MYHNFYYDFYNICFVDMFLKIGSLPRFGEILASRNSVFKNEKMDMKTRTSILKMMNKKQLEWIEENKKKAEVNNAISLVNSMSEKTSNIQKRNYQKMKERGLI